MTVSEYYILKRNDTYDWSYFNFDIWLNANKYLCCTGHFVVVFLRHCLLISQIYEGEGVKVDFYIYLEKFDINLTEPILNYLNHFLSQSMRAVWYMIHMILDT